MALSQRTSVALGSHRLHSSPARLSHSWLLCLLAAWAWCSRGSSQELSNRYCEDSFFWQPNGTRAPSDPDWSSTLFQMGPCLRVAGVGATQTYLKTLILVDRSDGTNTYLPLPEKRGALAFAEEVDLSGLEQGEDPHQAPQRALRVRTNAFCSSGQHVTGGTFLSIGGDPSGSGGGYRRAVLEGPGEPKNAPAVPEESQGSFSVRLFEPCLDGTCDFSIVSTLADRRWYPATQLLGDGRVFIVGGSKQGVTVNGPGANQPTVEYYPRQPWETSYPLKFLRDTLPFNLYPFVHLLPNGLVFICAGQAYTLWNTTANMVAPGRRPKLPATSSSLQPVFANYPLSGTSALFPLTPADNWQGAEIMICGGAPSNAINNLEVPAESRCWRIAPLDPDPVWVQEDMYGPRVMPLSVLLPDGQLLIHGGAESGWCAISPQSARTAVLEPELYDTATKSWNDNDYLGVSFIPRTYHACGFLLHDGQVFFSGSNPWRQITVKNIPRGSFPTEFRSEIYKPPYFWTQKPPPQLVSAPTEVVPGSKFSVKFKVVVLPKKIKVVLMQPGFSTHGSNHGMRSVELKTLRITRSGKIFTVTLAVPPSKNVLPPTWYWLFIVADGVPNKEGQHVFVN